MSDPQNDSKWDWHQCGSNRKKTCCFFSQIFTFFFEKKCGFVHRKISDEKVKKNEVQKKCPFCARSFWRLLDVQYYCGMLFGYKYWCLESLPGHYTPATAGRFFKKCQNFAKKSPLGHTFGGKMLLPGGATKIFFRKQILYAWTLFAYNG